MRCALPVTKVLCVSARRTAITVVFLIFHWCKKDEVRVGALEEDRGKLLKILGVITKPEGSTQCLTADL